MLSQQKNNVTWDGRNSNKPRILFIGLSESSHAQSFTDLFIDDFNVRFFALPTHYPPDNWKVRTYITVPNPLAGMDPQTRLCFYPTPEERDIAQKAYQHRIKWNPVWFLERVLLKIVNAVNQQINLAEMKFDSEQAIDNPVSYKQPPASRFNSSQAWLVEIIDSWQPDIIHTYGIEGGILLQDSWNKIKGDSVLPCVWIQQTRGGSDLTHNRFDPIYKERLLKIFHQCNFIICDNVINLKYLGEMGVDKKKFAPICPVPGTGGINIIDQSSLGLREHLKNRDIIWPKAYLSPYSLSLPVLEAIRLAWDHIQPCTIHMLAMDPATRLWYLSLPKHIRENCIVYNRIPRGEVFKLMGKCRVMLAPSLIDGVPNVLYEAMSKDILPIVSPLVTIKSIVSKKNVLFARNMYPQEIADALILAMNDDDLMLKFINRNIKLVNKIADRSKIRKKVLSFYEGLI